MAGRTRRAQPLEWMRVVRNAAPRLTTSRLAVLWALALRMDRNGAGFASMVQLADDSGTNERTARRATEDARSRDYLNRTRRGHRLGNGRTAASEWELTVPVDNPPQPDTGVLLSDTSTGQNDDLNRTEPLPQPDTGVRPRGLPPEVTPPQSAARSRAAQAITAAGATEDEIEPVLQKIRTEHKPRNLDAYVSTLAANGDLAAIVAAVQAEHQRTATDKSGRQPHPFEQGRSVGYCHRCGRHETNRVHAMTDQEATTS